MATLCFSEASICHVFLEINAIFFFGCALSIGSELLVPGWIDCIFSHDSSGPVESLPRQVPSGRPCDRVFPWMTLVGFRRPHSHSANLEIRGLSILTSDVFFAAAVVFLVRDFPSGELLL